MSWLGWVSPAALETGHIKKGKCYQRSQHGHLVSLDIEFQTCHGANQVRGEVGP
jgi:hypothetical protein